MSDKTRKGTDPRGKGPPRQARPGEALPEDGLPEDGLPEDGLPEDGLPEDGLPDETPSDGTPLGEAPRDEAPRADGRSERARRQRLSRRAQVLRAARAAFVVKGYHSTSVADIIRNAGIARGTFYLYFDSKRAIFEELLDGYLERIWGVVGRIEVGPGAPSPVEQLRDNVERVVDVLSEHRELNHILLRHAVGLDADFDQKLDEFYGRLLELIEGALGLGQSMGLVRRGDTRILSACVLGTIKEVTAQYLIAQPVPPAEEASGGAPSTGGEAATGTVFDREGLVREILSYNLHGLLHRREGPASGA